MKLYRVEDAQTGAGMFTADLVHPAHRKAMEHIKHTSEDGWEEYDYNHPDYCGTAYEGATVWSDCKGFTNDHYCGVKDADQLGNYWLRTKRYREEMAKLGVWVQYECPEEHVIQGEQQVAFRMDKAVRIGICPFPV